MSEDREARREARRRKILENSENRLQKITGVQNRISTFDIDGYKSPQTPNEPDGIPLTNGSTSRDSSSHLQDVLIKNSILGQVNNVNSPKVNLFANRISIIFCLAILHNCFLAIFNIKQIFISILCFEAIDILFYSEHKPTPFLIKALALIKVNIPKRQVVLAVRCFNLLKTFFEDVLLYFFFFICIFFVLCWLSQEKITFVS